MEADSQGASPDPRSGTAVSVVRSCAAGLSNLSFHTAKHILFMEGGALPSLIDMARTKDEQTRVGLVDAHCSYFDRCFQSRVATGLCNITYHEASCEACIKSGDVPVLLALARANHENTKRDCAAALCNLSNYVSWWFVKGVGYGGPEAKHVLLGWWGGIISKRWCSLGVNNVGSLSGGHP